MVWNIFEPYTNYPFSLAVSILPIGIHFARRYPFSPYALFKWTDYTNFRVSPKVVRPKILITLPGWLTSAGAQNVWCQWRSQGGGLPGWSPPPDRSKPIQKNCGTNVPESKKNRKYLTFFLLLEHIILSTHVLSGTIKKATKPLPPHRWKPFKKS